jgi:protein-disulfide isomerase
MRLAALAILFAMSAVSAGRTEMVEGNPASPVRVTIYEDLACPDCARFRAMLDEKILPKYGKRVAFVHRDFPLGKHEWARMAALAGRWTWQQSPPIGVIYRQELYAEQDHVTAANLKRWLLDFAGRHDLDEKGIVASMDDARLRARLDSDLQGGNGRGVTKVPSVFLGTQSFVENIQYEDLAKALDEALER